MSIETEILNSFIEVLESTYGFPKNLIVSVKDRISREEFNEEDILEAILSEVNNGKH